MQFSRKSRRNARFFVAQILRGFDEESKAFDAIVSRSIFEIFIRNLMHFDYMFRPILLLDHQSDKCFDLVWWFSAAAWTRLPLVQTSSSLLCPRFARGKKIEKENFARISVNLRAEFWSKRFNCEIQLQWPLQ